MPLDSNFDYSTDGKKAYEDFMANGAYANDAQREASLGYLSQQQAPVSITGVTADQYYTDEGQEYTPEPVAPLPGEKSVIGGTSAGTGAIGSQITAAPAPLPSNPLPPPTSTTQTAAPAPAAPAPAPAPTTSATQGRYIPPNMMNDAGWGATSVVGSGFKWMNPQGGGSVFSLVSTNPDGTKNWTSSDGQVFNNIDKAAFQQYFPAALADVYYSGSTTQQPGTTTPGTTTPGTTAPSTGQFPVTAWRDNSFDAEGSTFTIGTRNPDGTINWLRSDGAVFDNIPLEVAQMYFGSGVGRYYTGGGSTTPPPGGITPGGPLNQIPQDPNAGGGSINIGGNTISAPGINAPAIAAPPGAATYDPSQASLSYDETVEGRIGGMLSRGNPLLQKAEAMTMQRANARGLLNSSMAQDAAMSAMIQNAIPIAQADAGNLLQMRLQNAGFANQAYQFGADAANQLTKLGYTAQADLQKMALGGNIEMQKLLTAGQTDAAMELIRTQSQMALKELETNASNQQRASTSFSATMQTLQQGVTQILGSNLDAAAKTVAINQLVSHARGSIAVYGTLAGNINLLDQFDSIIAAPGGGGTTNPSPAPEAPSATQPAYDYRDTNRDGVVDQNEQWWGNNQFTGVVGGGN